MPDDGLLGGDTCGVGQDVDRAEPVDCRLMKCLDRIIGRDIEIEAEALNPFPLDDRDGMVHLLLPRDVDHFTFGLRAGGEERPDADIGTLRGKRLSHCQPHP